VTSKLDKYDWYYAFANLSLTSFATIDADLHRLRRAPINKHFSPASIIKIEPLIKHLLAILCRRLEEHRQAKKAVNIGMAYRCLANDIVSEYVIPVAPTLLKEENFAADYLLVI
jgi:cytochrome P450